MKKNLTFATVLLAIVVTFVSAAGAATPQENLVAGVFNLNTSTNWAGFSAGGVGFLGPWSGTRGNGTPGPDHGAVQALTDLNSL